MRGLVLSRPALSSLSSSCLGYLWITTFVTSGIVWNYVIRGWGIALACLTLVSAALGITDALSAMLGKPHIARMLCIAHVVAVGVTLVCQIAGYSQSLAEWVDYFGQCGSAQNPCVWDKDTAYARVGVSLALFTLFNTANLIFSILFAIRSRAGDTDTLIPGRSTPSTASLVKE